MSSREFSEWKAYYGLMAEQTRAASNGQAVTEQTAEPAGPVDMLTKVRAINRLLGGRDLTDGNTQ
jgi:hypothetical protein